MKESDDGSLHRRAGNRIHEPEEGKVRDSVANLGHQLTEPDQSEISRKQQAPGTHRARLCLCCSIVPRRISVDHQSLPRPHPSLSILTLSVRTAFTPGTSLAASAASNTITWNRTVPLSDTTPCSVFTSKLAAVTVALLANRSLTWRVMMSSCLCVMISGSSLTTSSLFDTVFTVGIVLAIFAAAAFSASVDTFPESVTSSDTASTSISYGNKRGSSIKASLTVRISEVTAFLPEASFSFSVPSSPLSFFAFDSSLLDVCVFD